MPSPAPIEIKRHYTELSAKGTDEVVAMVAALIVDFVKQRGGLTRSLPDRAREGGNGQVAVVGGQPADE